MPSLISCKGCKRVVLIEVEIKNTNPALANPGHSTTTNSVLQCACGKYL